MEKNSTLTFKERLDLLCETRLKLLVDIAKAEENLVYTKEELENKKLDIKIGLEKEISEADQAIIKTKYSNTEKRRLELEKRLNSDVTLVALKGSVTKLEMEILKCEGRDKVYRMQERYLFKEIELYIAEKELERNKDVRDIQR